MNHNTLAMQLFYNATHTTLYYFKKEHIYHLWVVESDQEGS